MYKFYLLAVTFFICVAGYGQTIDSLSKADKALLDSMMANDEFLKMLGEKEKNTFDISIGIGNGAFSTYNKAANATGVSNQVIFTPSVAYRLKNGLSLGITGYLTDEGGKTGLYQTGITAGYDYYGKKILAGVSYTRFLSVADKYNSKSLYQNDFFGYVRRAKGFIQPGLSLGYSNGAYKLAEYVSYKRTRRLLNPLRDTVVIVSGIDTTDNKANYFSVSANAFHDFIFYKVFDKNDELDFSPSFIANFGSDKIVQTHTNKIFDSPLLSSRKRVEATNKFGLQSVGLSLDFTYGVGKFFLQPSIYFDYYVPETTSKRLAAIYAVSAGFSF
jgi:hypothetical protein